MISVVNIDVFLFLLLAAVIACVREGGPSALDTTLSPSFISCCKSNDDDDDIDATDARGANWPLILYIYIYIYFGRDRAVEDVDDVDRRRGVWCGG